MNVFRYQEVHSVSTSLNPLDDLIDWLGYLTSPEYLIDVLGTRHHLSSTVAKARAKMIIPHVVDALAFMHQSLGGPPEVSFLPAYYAILNLAKVYILLGPRHADLPQHRWHGVTYNVEAKDSHSLLTEVVTVKRGGAFPLFYETLTSGAIARERTLKMGDVYPYIWDVGAEYSIATGQQSRIAALRCEVEGTNNQYRLKVKVLSPNGGAQLSIRNLAALRGLTKLKGVPDTFVSPEFSCASDKVDETARTNLDCRFIYYHSENFLPITAITRSTFPLPEEIPIFLMFFHMSSVLRYKPEFLARIRQSRFWPLLMSARRHSLYKFMLLFWSYVNKKQFIINPA